MSETEAGANGANGEVAVRYVPQARRFEARVRGSDEVAYLDVIPAGAVWTFTHTLVPRSLEGQGVGSELVRQALAHVRELGVTIEPVCPFTAAYLKRHPAERDVVHEEFMHLVER